MSEPRIIFEDADLLVVNKPAGMVVNKAETVKGQALQAWLEEHFHFPVFQYDDFIKDCRAGIVHRLDKETSGILLIAKTKQAFENLQKQFKERKIEKKYIALVHGRVSSEKGVIEAQISRSPFNRKKFGVFLGGREAKTEYEVRKTFSRKMKGEEKFYSLLDVYPKTGRTHQIRVHMKFIGHPVVGDEFYAGRKTSREDREWCPRQFLHASGLGFRHPITGEKNHFESELPVELKKALQELSS